MSDERETEAPLNASRIEAIVQTILAHQPRTQAVYLFGSHAGGEPWPASDVDLAILLPPDTARQAGSLAFSELRSRLEELVERDVDLVNLRLVSTVFQNEIIAGGRRVFCADEAVCDEFEALTLSFYQKLNAERAEILADFFRTKRAYPV
jgi:uncharacterized protein